MGTPDASGVPDPVPVHAGRSERIPHADGSLAVAPTPWWRGARNPGNPRWCTRVAGLERAERGDTPHDHPLGLHRGEHDRPAVRAGRGPRPRRGRGGRGHERRCGARAIFRGGARHRQGHHLARRTCERAGHRCGLRVHHQRASPGADPGRRRSREARAVREAAGALDGRSARDGAGVPGGRGGHGDQPPSQERRDAPGHARGDPRRADRPAARRAGDARGVPAAASPRLASPSARGGGRGDPGHRGARCGHVALRARRRSRGGGRPDPVGRHGERRAGGRGHGG